MQKRKFAVMTDSACDMMVDLEEKVDVDIVCFDITVDGKAYTERIDFDFDQYYEMLRTCEGIPATSQITTFRFLEQFEKYESRGVEDVLYVSINSTGSATNGNAQLAVEEFREKYPESRMNIEIVDSHSYSMTYGWYVAEAAKKLQNGAEFADVVAWLNETFSKMEIVLASYSLKFMKKSGRISAAAAFAGELLGLKPIVSLIDGKSIVQKKVRGDKEIMPSLMEFAVSHIDDTYEYMVGGTDQEKIDQLAAQCSKKWKTPPLCTFKLGAAVSTNTGPDCVAIVYVGQPRR
ncbi:MAG: DegV family protein [Oscillospiraceae bacterium]